MRFRTVWATPQGELRVSKRPPVAFDGRRRPLSEAELMPLPPGSLLTFLPGRFVGPGQLAVAAILPPGYVRTLHPWYRQDPRAPVLPLRSYTAVAERGGQFYGACARLDDVRNYGPRGMPSDLRERVEAKTADFARNAVVAQIARCALRYGCQTAANFFLEQGELAVPLSPVCNAKCVGCLSEPGSGAPSPQQRVRARLDEAHATRMILAHLEADPDAMISFGQGCEGEPLLVSTQIARIIRQVRRKTGAGIFHLNTNGSLPENLRELIEAGLMSVRVSLNSADPDRYGAYYRPRYQLADVEASCKLAVGAGLAVSLNLLYFPGVSDTESEMAALQAFLSRTGVGIVQVRDLNIDPAVYLKQMQIRESACGFESWSRRVNRPLVCFNRSAYDAARRTGAAVERTGLRRLRDA